MAMYVNYKSKEAILGDHCGVVKFRGANFHPCGNPKDQGEIPGVPEIGEVILTVSQCNAGKTYLVYLLL